MSMRSVPGSRTARTIRTTKEVVPTSRSGLEHATTDNAPKTTPGASQAPLLLLSGNPKAPAAPSAEQLMQQVAAGCDDAFRALMLLCWKDVATLCVRLSGDPVVGDELAQQTFVRIFERRQQYCQTGSFIGYASTIAYHTYLNQVKSSKREKTTSLDAAGQLSIPPQSEEASLVLSALRLLEPQARMAFVFRYYYGYTYPELAHELGVSKNTAKSRVAGAVSRLSKLLEGNRG